MNIKRFRCFICRIFKQSDKDDNKIKVPAYYAFKEEHSTLLCSISIFIIIIMTCVIIYMFPLVKAKYGGSDINTNGYSIESIQNTGSQNSDNVTPE